MTDPGNEVGFGLNLVFLSSIFSFAKRELSKKRSSFNDRINGLVKNSKAKLTSWSNFAKKRY